MQNGKLKILGFAGSLREDAYSKKVARFTLEKLSQMGVDTEFVDLRDFDIPLYDGDLQERAFPKGVQKFKNLIKEADAVLICSPEYNWASPGVLKNALNWSSRPYGDAAFDGKLVALMSSSPGRVGGARALLDLRTSLNEMSAWVYPPTVSVGAVHELLNEKGDIKDPQLVSAIEEFLSDFVVWARRFKEFGND